MSVLFFPTFDLLKNQFMDTFILIKKIHVTVVLTFLLIYFVKTLLLLANKNENLKNFAAKTKVLEMIVSFLFLATGVYLLIQKPDFNQFMIIKLVAVFASIPLAVIGFKKSNKVLSTLSLLLIITAYGMAEINAKHASKKEISSEVITDASNPDYDMAKHGEAIYKANCVVCHGEDGSLGINAASNLIISQMDEAAAIQIIANGKDNTSMKSYRDVLSEQEINAVAAYIQTLKK
jgi:mono/diheme cytochrome c family protein